MSDAVDSLILDLLEWAGSGERGYTEVMESWKTSCPKLPVWEEANGRGLLARENLGGRVVVRLTAKGVSLVEGRRGISKSGSSRK